MTMERKLITEKILGKSFRSLQAILDIILEESNNTSDDHYIALYSPSIKDEGKLQLICYSGKSPSLEITEKGKPDKSQTIPIRTPFDKKPLFLLKTSSQFVHEMLSEHIAELEAAIVLIMFRKRQQLRHFLIEKSVSSSDVNSFCHKIIDEIKRAPYFKMTEKFCRDWDQNSFDPDYNSEPLEHFKSMVEEVFRRPAWDDKYIKA